jgi:anti-sigma factor ChrR (cupin superfamily)
MNEDNLKQLWQTATTSAAGPHLSDETLVALACGELNGAARDAAAAHMANCHDCSSAVQALMRARRQLQAAAVPSVFQPARRSVWLPIAATVAFGALALGAWWSVQQPAQENIVQRSGAASIKVLTADGQALPRASFTLTWESPLGAREARVILFSADTTEIYRAEHVTGNSVTVPLQALQAIPAESSLFWTVDVTDAEGRVLSSGSRSVRVQ